MTAEKTVSLMRMEQLLKGIDELKIAMVKMTKWLASSRYRDSRSIWCDNAYHIHRAFEELKEVLRHDLVYYEGVEDGHHLKHA